MMMNRIWIITLSLFLFACEQDDVEIKSSGGLVVEGYLFAKAPIDSFKVMHISEAGEPTDYSDLENLSIKIITGDQDEIILKSNGNGIYSAVEHQVEEEQSYSLEIVFEDQILSASTYVRQQPKAKLSDDMVYMDKIESGERPDFTEQPSPIDITWNNEGNEYHYVKIENIESEREYINERLAEVEEGDRPPRFEIVTEPSITELYSINPRTELVYFGMHEVVVFRLNPEYAALYESNTGSSLSLSQPPGNIENGFGVFTGVSSDTLYLEVREN